jgi:tetratricopeptide (TPR) repeat protein
VVSGLSLTARAQGGASDMIKQGQDAYSRGDFKAAANSFDAAVRVEPDNIEAKLMLAKTLMQEFVPHGQNGPELLAGARKQFEDVLARDARNTRALHGMMMVSVNAGKFPEAKEWAQKTIASDATDASAYYVIGVADWTLAFFDYQKVRKAAGMKPEDPGIIPDAGLREQFRAQHMSQVEDGIRNLQTALQIKPDYSNAMAYMNLLYRIEAGVVNDTATSLELYKTADAYVAQTLEAQKKQAQSGKPADSASAMVPLPPPPPPPPPPPGYGGAAMVQVKGVEQQARLVKQVAAEGPAGVSGTVKLDVIIGKDGRVRNIQVVSAPPALVAPAITAVRQWVYQPLMLRGNPTEVATTVELSFPGQ